MIVNQTVRHKISRPALALILVMSTVVLPVGIGQAFSEDQPAQIANQTGEVNQSEKASKPVQESEDVKAAYAAGQKRQSGEADNAVDSPLHALVRAAWNASLIGLKSGKGEAEWKVYREERVVLDTLVDVVFSGPRYRLDFTFRKQQDGATLTCDRRTVVNDESALLCCDFSPRIKPLGCSIRAYEPSTEWLARRATFARATDGFISPPNALPRVMLGVDSELPFYRIAQQDNGMLLGTVETTHDIVKFFADPQYGHNVVRFENVGRVDPDNSALRAHATWERQDDVWFITSIVGEEPYPNTAVRFDFRYLTFAPNCRVGESAFGVEALQAPEGTRILTEDGDVHIYSTPPIDASSNRKSLLETVKSMKNTYSAEGE